MRFATVFFLVVTMVFTAYCAVAADVPTTEEGVAREAEELVRLSLTERLMEGTAKYYLNQVSSMLAGEKKIPIAEAEELVEAELQPLLETEHQRLIEALAPIYMRYYTADEIHQLLSFYQSEVARKSMRVSEQIAAESQTYARLWSENLGSQLMEKVGLEQ